MVEPVVQVKIAQGELRGRILKNYLGENYYSFQGIPYAKSPVGELRFKAPLPPEPWTGVFDATKEGPESPSTHLMFQNYVGAEDNCLNLNVYIKELPSEEKPLKPVMVWIHGGGFVQCSNRSYLFGADYLMTEDVVQVFINYRLGVLGFLCLEDPELGVPGNNGLKDMVQALKWVKANISHFGGDSNNVTIYGESAGSAAVEYLVLSPLAKGLFHKAIMQSGSTLSCWSHGRRGAQHLLKYMGYNETDEKKILKYLQKASLSKLIVAQSKIADVMSASAVRPFGPVVEKIEEGAFLAQEPEEIFRSGNYNKVPMIIGMTSCEGLLYEIVRKTRTAKFNKTLEPDIPYNLNLKPKSEAAKEVAQKIRKFYYGKEEPSEDNMCIFYKLISDNHFVYGILRSIDYQLEHNTNPIYLYVFSYEGEFNFFKKFLSSKFIHGYFACQFIAKLFNNERMKDLFMKLGENIGFKKLPGASHADDLGYFFRSFYSPKVILGSETECMIKRCVKMWTNFAKYDNPTPDTNDDLLKVRWDRTEKNSLNYLDIKEPLEISNKPFNESKQFWDEIYTTYKNK